AAFVASDRPDRIRGTAPSPIAVRDVGTQPTSRASPAGADEPEPAGAGFQSRWFSDAEDFREKIVALMVELWLTGRRPAQEALGDAVFRAGWYAESFGRPSERPRPVRWASGDVATWAGDGRGVTCFLRSVEWGCWRRGAPRREEGPVLEAGLVMV